MNETVDIVVAKRRIAVSIEGLTPLEIVTISRQVDEKMAEIAENNKKIADSGKLAILAALHIAAELYKLKQAGENSRNVVYHAVDRLSKTLRESLAAAASGSS